MRVRVAFAALGVAVGMLLGTGLAGAVPEVGTKAPNVEMPTISGDKFKLSAIEGKQPILLNFFATW